MENEMMKGFETKHLLAFDVDLRIAMEVRLAEVSRRLTDCKDELGKRHLCADIAYLDGGKVKWANTGCYVREDDEALYVCLLFPVGVTVNILENHVETAINVLEYRIDKFTEAMTEIARLDDENTCKGNVLFFDFGLIDSGQGVNTPAFVESILEQVRKIKDWSVPIMGRFKVRANREYYIMSSGTWLSGQSKVELWFSLPFASTLYYPNGYNLTVEYEGDQIYMSENLEGADFRVLFLTLNDDLQVDTADNNACLKGDWNRFYQMMQRGGYPGVYLKTWNNGGYYPAHYSFEPVGDAFRGKIGCLYVKEIDGVKKLVSHELVFDATQNGASDFTGFGQFNSEYHEFTLA